MIKTVYSFGLLGCYLISTLPLLAKAKRLRKQGRLDEHRELLARKAVKLVNFASRVVGITYDIQGYENIPEGTVLYAANHQGLFDAFVMLTKLREPCGFLIKKQAGSIPILSSWMREMGCVFVDRENPREAVKSINEGAEIIRSGRSLVVFPEGTRSKTGELGEFKNGAIKIAQKTGCPIVPVAIDGTRKVFEEKGRVRSAHIKVRILPAVEVKELSRAEFKDVAPRLRAIVQQARDNM